MRTCTTCNISKPDTEEFFYSRKTQSGCRRQSPQCRECIKNKSREYRKNNPDKIREYHKKYYHHHAEKLREVSRVWNQENKERRREYLRQKYAENPTPFKIRSKRYTVSNPIMLTLKNHRRRNSMLQAEGILTEEDWEIIKTVYGNLCAFCRKAKKLTIDHIIPVTLGGTHWPENIQPLCGSCNARKGNRLNDFNYYIQTHK